MINDDLILAFDTVISSGDASVWRNEKEISSIGGDIEASSSETLLTSISGLLNESNLAKRNITLCALTIGPGSYTGIRIGIATALGLSRALGCKVYGVCSLKLLSHAGVEKDSVVSGVWAGRNEIVYQQFTSDGVKESEMELMTVEDFIRKYNGGSIEIILDRKSYEAIGKLDDKLMKSFKTPSANVASILAKIVEKRDFDVGDGKLTPIYSRSLFDR